MNTTNGTLWLSLELDPGTADFFGLHPRLYVPADASPSFGGVHAARLTLSGLGEALQLAAAANPDMAARADVLRFLNRWPRYADLERYLRVDNPTFAETVARNLLENDPEDPPALAALAVLAARGGRWSEARDRLDRVLSVAPTHAQSRLQRALARAALGETAPALAELEELARRPRVQSLARFWRHEVGRGATPERLSEAVGLVHGLQDADGARAAWDELARVFPDNPEVLYTEGVRPGAETTEDARRDRLIRALAASPEHVPARVALATLLRSSGAATEALALVDDAPRAGDREHPLLAAVRGRILEQLGRNEAAREVYRALFAEPLALLPPTALAAAGRGLARLEDPETARRRLEEAAGARPGDSLCPRILAELDERLEGRDAAERRLRAAARTCGPVPALQYALGDLLRRSGRGVEAEGLFKVLARRHPESPWGHRGLGDLAAAERPAEALEHYARARELDPWLGLPGHDELRGAAALRAGDPETACGWFERAVAADPGRAGSWSALGTARFRAGDLDGAFAAAGRALALEPEHPGYLRDLAALHRERFRKHPWRAWRSWWTARRLERRASRAARSAGEGPRGEPPRAG